MSDLEKYINSDDTLDPLIQAALIQSRSMEGKLEKLTKYAAILWLILALVLNLKFL